MSQPVETLGLYLHLARASGLRRRPLVRDQLLIIAATGAALLGLPRIAAHCRRLILDHNPKHLIRRWSSLDEALGDSDFLQFLKQVQRRYPQEKAERMRDELGIVQASERDAYYTDEEYAAAILGASTDSLVE